jgi:hypothetical protein
MIHLLSEPTLNGRDGRRSGPEEESVDRTCLDLSASDLRYLRNLIRSRAIGAAAKYYAGKLNCGMREATRAIGTLQTQIRPAGLELAPAPPGHPTTECA